MVSYCLFLDFYVNRIIVIITIFLTNNVSVIFVSGFCPQRCTGRLIHLVAELKVVHFHCWITFHCVKHSKFLHLFTLVRFCVVPCLGLAEGCGYLLIS